MDVREILGILPHRYPFLLVDRVLEVSENKIVALKNVSVNEPFFQGHFPGHPVMPGVLILEAMAQAGALLATRSSGFDAATQVIYFMAIDKAKFRKPVVPGDQLILEMTTLRGGGKVWKLRGEAKVAGTLVSEAELLATVAKK
jgi:3-hydroxyacyl-[acyl-carrier-protein] dehydratase